MKATINTHPVQTMNTSDSVESAVSSSFVQPTLIKKKELAKRLSVSTRSIDGWVSKRVIPYIQITPRFYLYEFDAVLAALKKHYQIEPVTRN
jgi:DNA-binding transcriptional regulator LsrR (DeoR family)